MDMKWELGSGHVSLATLRLAFGVMIPCVPFFLLQGVRTLVNKGNYDYASSSGFGTEGGKMEGVGVRLELYVY